MCRPFKDQGVEGLTEGGGGGGRGEGGVSGAH